MNTVLQTNGLTKKFGSKTAVDHVSMTIKSGEIYGFIGKNGAGKTTFMRMILGMAIPKEGTIELFDGMPLSEARKRIGSLIETPAFYRNCSAFENMKRFGYLSGATDTDIQQILDFVGLGNVANKKAGQFSLGMKQRLGIALALLGKPSFIILDEPVNGLDPTGIKEIRDLIISLNRQYGITFLISSHLLDELSKVVTKYGIINNGVLVEEITAADLEGKCRQRLVISVNDTKAAYDLLSTKVDPRDMIYGDSSITLLSHIEDAADINRFLTENNLLVSGISTASENVEQYFIERIGY